MKHGFVKVAAANFEITVADCKKNADKIIALAKEAADNGVKILVFPELSVCGSTCGDLFFSDTLLTSAQRELCRIVDSTKEFNTIIIVGFPCVVNNKIYNSLAFFQKGEILGIVPKSALNASESRYFARYERGVDLVEAIDVGNYSAAFGNILFSCNDVPSLKIGADVGAEAFDCIPPSSVLAQRGATVIVNPFAGCELVGSEEYRRVMLTSLSARNLCGYIHAASGAGESTTDGVFGGGCAIYENGKLLASSPVFSDSLGLTITELDLGLISGERRRNTFFGKQTSDVFIKYFDLALEDTVLTRNYPVYPFVPEDISRIPARCERILDIQARGLAQRIVKAYAKKCVIGISGGLDSCLAVLVAARAMDILGRPRTDILGVTMPCFGTTGRTRSNAEILCASLGTDFRCVNIGESVKQHFSDIGQSEDCHDVVYENAQARERTQVIMDIANMEGGFVVGTGDLSELVLGWATYNGDHMSMYGVNGGVPKTLIRHIVAHCADVAEADGNAELATALRDILDTPVSPELLPADENGNIAQKTEDLVGPYEIHDFYIFYMLRYGFSPDKLLRIAKCAFEGKYSDEVLLKWLKNLVRRFFAQQFKRSCLPDGPKVGTVGISPRGDLIMPSDASSREWLDSLE